MGRKTVSFDKGRAFFRPCNIPRDKSHLRNHLCSIQAHLLCFFPEWNLESDDACIRHRMFDKRIPLFIGTDSLKLTCLDVNAGCHATAVYIIHHFSVADSQKSVYDSLLFVTEQRRNPACIHRRGTKRCHFGMLDNNLFKDSDSVFPELFKKCSGTVFPVRFGIFLYSDAAGSFQGLPDQL